MLIACKASKSHSLECKWEFFLIDEIVAKETLLAAADHHWKRRKMIQGKRERGWPLLLTAKGQDSYEKQR